VLIPGRGIGQVDSTVQSVSKVSFPTTLASAGIVTGAVATGEFAIDIALKFWVTVLQCRGCLVTPVSTVPLFSIHLQNHPCLQCQLVNQQ